MRYRRVVPSLPGRSVLLALVVVVTATCAACSDNQLHLNQDAVIATNLNLTLFSLGKDGFVYGARGNELHRIINQGSSAELVHRFDDELKGIHFSRSGAVLVSTDNDHWSQTTPCRIYFAESVGRPFRHVFTLRESSALWWSLASDSTGTLYIGEYGPQDKGLSERVWRSTDNAETWHSVFRAPNEKGVHIHRVAVDPFNDDVWVTNGDGKYNRGTYRSSDSGDSWQMVRSSQATAIAFTDDSIIWGEDHRKGIVTQMKKGGLSEMKLFQASRKGHYGGSIYDLALGAGSKLYVPLMKYPDQDHHASVWVVRGKEKALLIDYGSSPGMGSGSETVAGPDRDGWVYVKGYKIKDAEIRFR